MKTKIRYGKPFLPHEIITPKMDDEEKYAAVTKHLQSEIELMLDDMRK